MDQESALSMLGIQPLPKGTKSFRKATLVDGVLRKYRGYQLPGDEEITWLLFSEQLYHGASQAKE